MFNHYRAAFEPRGSLSFSAAGLLGRLPASMVGLGIILFVSSKGDYGLAGTLVGIQALAACVGGPAQGRVADRFGQARTLLPVAGVFGVALTGLILGLRADVAFAVLAPLAVLVGASSPTTGTLARSRWSALHRPGTALQTAFAVEAVFDEVVFVTGPVIVTVLATRANPLIALVLGGAAGVVGSVLMAVQRRTQPPVAPRPVSGATNDDGTAVAARSRLPYLLLAPLLVAQLTVGIIFGSIDVTTVAEATATGHRQYAGLILACFSGGSLVAGLVVGAINWRMTPIRRVRMCVCVLGFATLLLPVVPSIRLLPVAGFVIGLTVSPALVALAAAVQALTPADRLTEAMAVATAALVAGFSLGSASAGQLIDRVGPHRAFLQAAGAGLLATVAVLAPAVTGRVSAARRRPVPVSSDLSGSRPTGRVSGPVAELPADPSPDATDGGAPSRHDPGSRPAKIHGRTGAARGMGLRGRPGRVGRIFRRADRRVDPHAPGPRRVSGRSRRH